MVAEPEALRPGPGTRNASAIIASLAVVALGGFVLHQAVTGPAALGYAQVGPGVFPTVVGSGLVLIGLALLAQAWRARWQVAWTEADDETQDTHASSPAMNLALIGAGLVADVMLMAPLGFVPAATVLFVCVSRAFGSRRLVLDLLIGLAFTVLIFVIFTRGLGLSLPVGDVWESFAWMP